MNEINDLSTNVQTDLSVELANKSKELENLKATYKAKQTKTIIITVIATIASLILLKLIFGLIISAIFFSSSVNNFLSGAGAEVGDLTDGINATLNSISMLIP